MADIKYLIGDRIRYLRKKKGLSQEELGWKAKLHYTYVGAVERGEKNVSVETLNKIARALGVGINDVFDLPKEIKDPNKLRSSLIEEINKSAPDILKITLSFIRGLNGLINKLVSQKRRKRHRSLSENQNKV